MRTIFISARQNEYDIYARNNGVTDVHVVVSDMMDAMSDINNCSVMRSLK